jgi:hypothetical protein
MSTNHPEGGTWRNVARIGMFEDHYDRKEYLTWPIARMIKDQNCHEQQVETDEQAYG